MYTWVWVNFKFSCEVYDSSWGAYFYITNMQIIFNLHAAIISHIIKLCLWVKWYIHFSYNLATIFVGIMSVRIWNFSSGKYITCALTYKYLKVFLISDWNHYRIPWKGHQLKKKSYILVWKIWAYKSRSTLIYLI